MPDFPIQLLTEDLFLSVQKEAAASPRRRMNYNFHASLKEPLHRFLNVILKGSYIRPHRHTAPPKPESFVILQGKLAFFIFGDNGSIQEVHLLGDEGTACPRGIDIQPGIWHSLVALSESVVCFEVKPGPYEKSSDKDFAAWAPPEGTAEATAYVEKLEKAVPQKYADG